MQLDQLHQKLIAAARKTPLNGSVPYAYEKRIMAQIRGVSAPDGWILWSRALWKAAIPCLMVVLVASLWSSNSKHPDTVDFSMQFEDTVLAELNQNLENSW